MQVALPCMGAQGCHCQGAAPLAHALLGSETRPSTAWCAAPVVWHLDPTRSLVRVKLERADSTPSGVLGKKARLEQKVATPLSWGPFRNRVCGEWQRRGVVIRGLPSRRRQQRLVPHITSELWLAALQQRIRRLAWKTPQNESRKSSVRPWMSSQPLSVVLGHRLQERRGGAERTVSGWRGSCSKSKNQRSHQLGNHGGKLRV